MQIADTKIMLRKFIDRNIFYAGCEKSEIKERTWKTRKGFDQGTVVIQPPSFTTSTDYGYCISYFSATFLSRKPSMFKISETLPHHGSANHCTIVDGFSGVTVHTMSRGLRASGPLGLRAAGPLGHRGPWAAGLLLAKPVLYILVLIV